MKKTHIILVMAFLGLISFSSCTRNDDNTLDNLNLSFTGLEDLGPNYAYEGWILVDGVPSSAGIFTVDGSGTPSTSSFNIDISDLTSATAYILTIEPSPDNDPNPSDVHILAGDFNGNTASLNVDHSAALGTDFITSTGKYILATPTDGGSMTNEKSGVWWLDPMAGPGAGLSLPNLPAGWKYEGWAVVNGTPLTTGKFTVPSGADAAAPYSGTSAAGPPFPGEDFLINAPTGLSFPVDLSGKTVVISVEPEPDNSPAPFLLKPLVGMVPSTALDHTVYNMNNNALATNPTGTATR